MPQEIFLWYKFISNKFWNMLLSLFLQLLGCSTHVHYHSDTSICIQYYFADEQAEHPLEQNATSFFEEKTILANTDPKQLLTVHFVYFSYLRKMFPVQGNFRYSGHFSGLNCLDV